MIKRFAYDYDLKKVMITGACGSLGKTLAGMYGDEGATLILTDVKEREEELIQFAEQLRNNGANIYTYCMDNTVFKEVDKTVDKIISDCDEVDILINNAGINHLTVAENITEDVWDMVVDTNLKGTFFVSKAVASKSLIQQKGNIVNISSQHGVVGNVERAHYCASKAGIINMTRALALEWAKYDVRVNSVSPTFILNEKNREILMESSFKRTNMANIPLKRYALPDDVAYATMFLTSKYANMITGHNLLVDGGWTAK